ncbi:methyl-accepting chemotaxis protein [Aliikangiella marina]|nr:methyl-accepting chemotaxis protein [Aliikangiella marina]
MNLTVTARIVGGAGLVMLLLVMLSFTGLSGVSSIEDGLNSVTDKSTPMLISGSENLSSLLEASVSVSRYHQTRQSGSLSEIESNYNASMTENEESARELQAVAAGYPDILNSLNASRESIEQYKQVVPQMFAAHKSDLTLGERIEGMRGDFEDVADELDTYLFDFSDDLGGGATADSLQSMSNMIREGTVTITDTLISDDANILSAAIKDINALVKDLDSSFSSVQQDSTATNNEYYSDTLASITKFKQLTTGNDNILSVYQQQLNRRDEAKKLLAQSSQIANEGKAHLQNVFTKVKGLTQNIKNDAAEKVSSSRTLLIVIALIAILFALGINLWVVRSITGPLNEVLRVIGKVAEGDLTDKAKVYRKDELGRLSHGFNALIDALSGMLKEISSSSQQLSASAEQTTEISRQGNDNINHQKEQTEMIATAMTEMTATVDEVANSASNTLLEVQKANDEAIDGKRVVQDSIETINRLAEEIEQAAQVTDKLDQYSTNIGAVLDVIRGIADQTNLLALNAAIEAARAGEQGRGFAVVADEVRTLASKTQESTSEIQEMIERLQDGTREAVAVMKSSRNEAQNSVEKTAVAGESLHKITEAVNVINDMSTHIASAAEEQSSVSLEMNQNVTSISEMADKTAQGSSENLAASQELARLAEHLQVLIGKFKY